MYISFFIWFGFPLMSCTQVDQSEDEQLPNVVVSLSHPVGFLVDSLLNGVDAGLVDHQILLPNEADSAVWRPTTEQIVHLQQADLLVATGLGFEPWMKTTALPSSIILVASQGLDAIQIPEKTHSHGKGGAHSHGKDLPTVWLNPSAMKNMLDSISIRLQKILPAEASISTNHQQLTTELMRLENIRQDLLASQYPKIASVSPAFSYLFQGTSIPVELLDVDDLTLLDSVQMMTRWSTDNSGVFIWEMDQQIPLQQSLDGQQIIVLDPLYTTIDGEYKYWSRMEENFQMIQGINAQLKGDQP